MRRLLVLASALVLIMGLALVGCDSDDNGGGGTTPAAATGSTMAGTWDIYLVVGPATSLAGRVTIDQNGKIASYSTPWMYCGPLVNAKRVSGSLTTTGGSVTFSCAGWPTFVAYVDQYRLRTVHENRLQGSMVQYFRSHFTIPKFSVILVRR